MDRGISEHTHSPQPLSYWPDLIEKKKYTLGCEIELRFFNVELLVNGEKTSLSPIPVTEQTIIKTEHWKMTLDADTFEFASVPFNNLEDYFTFVDMVRRFQINLLQCFIIYSEEGGFTIPLHAIVGMLKNDLAKNPSSIFSNIEHISFEVTFAADKDAFFMYENGEDQWEEIEDRVKNCSSAFFPDRYEEALVAMEEINKNLPILVQYTVGVPYNDLIPYLLKVINGIYANYTEHMRDVLGIIRDLLKDSEIKNPTEFLIIYIIKVLLEIEPPKGTTKSKFAIMPRNGITCFSVGGDPKEMFDKIRAHLKDILEDGVQVDDTDKTVSDIINSLEKENFGKKNPKHSIWNLLTTNTETNTFLNQEQINAQGAAYNQKYGYWDILSPPLSDLEKGEKGSISSGICTMGNLTGQCVLEYRPYYENSEHTQPGNNPSEEMLSEDEEESIEKELPLLYPYNINQASSVTVVSRVLDAMGIGECLKK